MPLFIDIPVRLLLLPGFYAVTPLAFFGFRDSNPHDLGPLWGLSVAMNCAFYFVVSIVWLWRYRVWTWLERLGGNHA